MYEGANIGSPIIYWILRVVLFLIFVYCGWGISRHSQKYTKFYVRFAGISFSLIEGLRWMRSVDYYHYYNDLVTLFGTYSGLYGRGLYTKDPDFLYELMVNVFHFMHLPFWVVFTLYSAFLIFAFLKIVQEFPKGAMWSLPLFFILTAVYSENLIRQYIALSFGLWGYWYYIKHKAVKTALMMICAFFFHFSAIVYILAFYVSIYLNKNLSRRQFFNSKMNMYLLIGLFVFVYFMWDQTYFEGFANFISEYVNLGTERSAHYIENAEHWFTANGSVSARLGRAAFTIGLIKNTSRFLVYFAIIYWGFLLKAKEPRLMIPYFMAYLAVILHVLAADIEMYIRFYNWFVVFIPIVLGEILTTKVIQIDPMKKIICIVLVIMYFFYYGAMSIYYETRLTGYGFIWDAKVNLF